MQENQTAQTIINLCLNRISELEKTIIKTEKYCTDFINEHQEYDRTNYGNGYVDSCQHVLKILRGEV